MAHLLVCDICREKIDEERTHGWVCCDDPDTRTNYDLCESCMASVMGHIETRKNKYEPKYGFGTIDLKEAQNENNP